MSGEGLVIMTRRENKKVTVHVLVLGANSYLKGERTKEKAAWFSYSLLLTHRCLHCILQSHLSGLLNPLQFLRVKVSLYCCVAKRICINFGNYVPSSELILRLMKTVKTFNSSEVNELGVMVLFNYNGAIVIFADSYHLFHYSFE